MPVRLNLYDLLNRKQRVWVQNTTNPIGVISLTLASGTSFPIPKSRDPICLSEHMSPDDLKDSHSIRMSLQKGFLRLVPDPHAQLYYEQTGKDPDKALTMQDDILQKRVMEAPEAKEVSQVAEMVQVSPHVQQMCLEFRHSGITDAEVTAKLELEWDSFSQNDIGYVTASVGRAAVVRWISQKLIAPPPTPPVTGEPEEVEEPVVPQGEEAPAVVSPPKVVKAAPVSKGKTVKKVTKQAK